MAEYKKHTLTSFDAALSSLRNDVVTMSRLTERLFENAVQGLLKRDNDLCNLTIGDDEEIDLLEKEVDRKGIEVLTRFHPVASDLRRVISAMKLGTNLERVADQSVMIARRAKALNRSETAVSEVSLIEPLYREAIGLFRDSLRAFVDGNAELARELEPRDRLLDKLNADLNEKATEQMALTDDQERAQDLLHTVFIARALERIGDYATNIAAAAIWVELAEDIRHTYDQKKED